MLIAHLDSVQVAKTCGHRVRLGSRCSGPVEWRTHRPEPCATVIAGRGTRAVAVTDLGLDGDAAMPVRVSPVAALVLTLWLRLAADSARCRCWAQRPHPAVLSSHGRFLTCHSWRSRWSAGISSEQARQNSVLSPENWFCSTAHAVLMKWPQKSHHRFVVPRRLTTSAQRGCSRSPGSRSSSSLRPLPIGLLATRCGR